MNSARTWSALVAVTMASCLSPIDLSDKRCPCASGAICDLSRDRCVSEQCSPAVRVDDFRAEWATSNLIRWAWTPSGDRSQFVRYELQLAERVEDLGTSNAIVFGPAQNPELASYALPRTGGTEDLVTSTVSFGLRSQRSMVAQLIVFDSALCAFRSPAVAKATTLDLPDEVVIFRDAVANGSGTYPTSFRVTPDDTGAGNHLAWVPDLDPVCAAGTTRVCGNNLRLTDLPVDLRRISAGGFANGFLEFRVANEGTSPSFFSRTWLTFGDCRESGIYRLEPFTIPPTTEYRIVQVPLRALISDTRGVGLTIGDLATDGGSRVCQFNVGGSFSRNSSDGGMGRVRVDEVRIRY